MKNISTYLVVGSISSIAPIIVLFAIGKILIDGICLGVALVCFVVGAVIDCKEIEREENEKLKIIFDTLEKMKENERGQDL